MPDNRKTGMDKSRPAKQKREFTPIGAMGKDPPSDYVHVRYINARILPSQPSIEYYRTISERERESRKRREKKSVIHL